MKHYTIVLVSVSMQGLLAFTSPHPSRVLPFCPKSHRIMAMQKAEIKQIADYLKDLEEGLYEWDYRGITTQGHLTKLYGIIERLMDATFETKDQELKTTFSNIRIQSPKVQGMY